MKSGANCSTIRPEIKLPKTHMKVGYARVSTQDQSLDLQLDALTRAGCTRIYQERVSGKAADRPELAQCLKALREGDTLVVWRLDRLGRNLSDLVAITQALEKAGTAFESITENIETSSATGRLVFHVFAALAEFERNLVRERTMAGLAAARARGRQGGRKPILKPREVDQVRTLYADKSVPIEDICKRYKISRTTFYNLVRSTT